MYVFSKHALLAVEPDRSSLKTMSTVPLQRVSERGLGLQSQPHQDQLVLNCRQVSPAPCANGAFEIRQRQVMALCNDD